MKKIIAVFSMVLAIFFSANPAHSQKAGEIYRIGFLTTGSPVKTFKLWLATFREGLRDLGYIEGKNIVIEERYGEGWRERIPELAAELVRLNVDVIVSHGAPLEADRAAKKAGKTIPIVFVVSADPIGAGLVASLAHPGGNITGLSDAHSELVPKRLQLLKQIIPSARRIAVFWSSDFINGARQLKTLQAVAPVVGVTLIPIEFKELNVDRAFDALRRERPDALNVFGWPLIATYRKRIAAFALENHLPTISTSEINAKAGLLMTYGVSFHDLYRRVATFVDKILKGAKPAELPVERPTKFYLTLNLKTAKALGITFPPSLLLSADKVIE